MTTDLELEEQRVLAAARREFSPDAQALARVRMATEAALLVPPSAVPPTGAGPLHVLWRAPGLATRLATALVLSASAGLVGYELGARSVAPRASDVRQMTAPVVVAVPVPETPRAADPMAVAAPAAAPAPDTKGAPIAPTAEASAQHAPRARSASLPVRTVSPADALQLELSTIKRVESELRVGNPSRALELLRELDARVPGGQLQQERSAADAIARCALGLGDAAALGDAFLARFPDSVYAARVRQRCDEAAR